MGRDEKLHALRFGLSWLLVGVDGGMVVLEISSPVVASCACIFSSTRFAVILAWSLVITLSLRTGNLTIRKPPALIESHSWNREGATGAIKKASLCLHKLYAQAFAPLAPNFMHVQQTRDLETKETRACIS